jgi:hypothetical protein
MASPTSLSGGFMSNVRAYEGFPPFGVLDGGK